MSCGYEDRRWYPMNARHFVYTLTDPRTGLVMYVGCTLSPKDREKQHRGANSTKPIGRWMDELLAAGVEPMFAVVAVIRSRDKARRLERDLIAQYQASGQCCLNRKNGRKSRFDRANEYTRAG